MKNVVLLRSTSMEKDNNTAPSLFFSHFFSLGSFWPRFFSSLGQCSNNDDHHTSIYLQLKITTRY
jgi:hypothetical protein